MKFVLLLLLCMISLTVVRGEMPRSRDVLIVDPEARVLGQITPSVWILDHDTRNVRPLSVSSSFVGPVAVALTPTRSKMYVVDADADPLNLQGDYGAVWLTNPEEQTAASSLAAFSTLFRSPADLLVEPDGRILLLDSAADPAGWGQSNGALFRIDPVTNTVSLLAAPAAFRLPRSLAWDRDGNILVLDRLANPLNLATSAGAIFRVNRSSGVTTVLSALTPPTFAAPSAISIVRQGPYTGDLIVADANADPEDRGTRPGAVFRIPRGGGAPVVVVAHPEFVEPVDVLVSVDGDLLVLDSQSNPLVWPNAQGALFRLDMETGDLIHRTSIPLFGRLERIFEVDGPDVVNSSVNLIDENLGLARPGDLFTMRARIRNSGTGPASYVVLTDQLSDPWAFVAGSDSVGAGSSSFDQAAGAFLWEGELGVGEETVIRYRVRLGNNASIGSSYDRNVTVHLGEAVFTFPNRVDVRTDFAPGDELFVDAFQESGQFIGLLYQVDREPPRYPLLLWRGAPLRRPVDLAFLEDGSLAILDEGRPRPGSDTLGAVIRFEPSRDRMTVVRYLTQSDGLATPAGIVLGRDGSVIVIDRNANPEGHTPPPGSAGPGALFRLDWRTGELSFLLSDERWVEPRRGAFDRSGNLLIIDPGIDMAPQPILWRIPRTGGLPVRRELDPAVLRFPTGIAVDSNNDIFLADPLENRIVRVRSASQIIVSADPELRDPMDLAVMPDGRLLIIDREANPRSYPVMNTGAAFYLDPTTGALEVAAASPGLVMPSGVCVLRSPDFESSSITLLNPVEDQPQPGDTLVFTATIANRGSMGLDNAMALIQVTSNLSIEDVEPSDEMYVDEDAQQVIWTGRSSIGDSKALTLRATVREGTHLGDVVGATLTVLGGPAPVVSQVTRIAKAPLIPGDLLLADSESDPMETGGAPGALFRLRDDDGKPAMVFTSPDLVGVSAIEWTPAGELFLTVMNGQDPGRLYSYDPIGHLLSEPIDTIPGSPTDLFYSPGGDLFIVDRDVQGPAPESRGTLYRKPGGTGALEAFSADSLYRSPTQGAFGPGGFVYLADSAADPDELGGNQGAVFRLDPETGEVLDWLQHSWLIEPTGVLSYDDSTLVLTDMSGEGDSDQGAMLFYYRPLSGTLARMVISPLLGRPWRSLLHVTGEVLVVDQEPQFPQNAGLGCVIGYDPARNVIRYYALSDSFATPSDLLQVPGPLVGFDRYTLTDVNGPPLHPADRVRVESRVHNRGPVAAEGVVWNDGLPPEAALLAETVATDPPGTGMIEITTGQGLRWTGDLPPGESVRIVYEAQLNPALSEGRMIGFRAEVEAPTAGTLTREIKVQTHVPLEAGYLYLADTSARPFGADAPGTGALFKVNLVTGAVVTMLTSDLFQRPRSVAFYDGPNPFFLILDERADFAPGHRGSLLRFDPASRTIEAIAGHSTWLQPVKVLRWSDTEALVLDSRADPFGLTPGVTGPGAIYHVDLESRLVTPSYSDTVFRVPTSLAHLSGNRLAVCDESAVPEGSSGGIGAVFSLDMDTQGLTLFATSRHWSTPTSIAAMQDGGLFLADRDATPESGGGLFRISPSGGVMRLTDSPLHSRLVEVQDNGSGLPIVTDNMADPFGFGGTPGALFGFNSRVAGRSVPIASSPLFSSPAGFFVYGQLTPAGAVAASAEALAEGIRLSFKAPSDETGIRFLIYRRVASGPDDPGDPQPTAEYDLTGGGDEFYGPGPHEFLDREVAPGTWYVYLLARIDLNGGVDYQPINAVQAIGAAVELRLLPPRPNPSPGAGVIRFDVPPPGGEVKVEVFDVSGRRVRVLHRGPSKPGVHTLIWQGSDDSGRLLSCGLYFLRLEHAGRVRTQRLVLLR